MVKTRPPYPSEFRAKAERLARLGGWPLAEIARDLGCPLESLRDWVWQTGIDTGEAEVASSDERAEPMRATDAEC